jgi:hypothetical protein
MIAQAEERYKEYRASHPPAHPANAATAIPPDRRIAVLPQKAPAEKATPRMVTALPKTTPDAPPPITLEGYTRLLEQDADHFIDGYRLCLTDPNLLNRYEEDHRFQPITEALPPSMLQFMSIDIGTLVKVSSAKAPQVLMFPFGGLSPLELSQQLAARQNPVVAIMDIQIAITPTVTANGVVNPVQLSPLAPVLPKCSVAGLSFPLNAQHLKPLYNTVVSEFAACVGALTSHGPTNEFMEAATQSASSGSNFRRDVVTAWAHHYHHGKYPHSFFDESQARDQDRWALDRMLAVVGKATDDWESQQKQRADRLKADGHPGHAALLTSLTGITVRCANTWPERAAAVYATPRERYIKDDWGLPHRVTF